MDTFNKFGVGSKGDKIVILRPLIGQQLSKEDALNLAAWLATLADMHAGEPDSEFGRMLEAVQDGT